MFFNGHCNENWYSEKIEFFEISTYNYGETVSYYWRDSVSDYVNISKYFLNLLASVIQ